MECMEHFAFYAVDHLGMDRCKGRDFWGAYERGMITFCFLAVQRGCELQLTSHARGNMNLGNNKNFLIRVIS